MDAWESFCVLNDVHVDKNRKTRVPTHRGRPRKVTIHMENIEKSWNCVNVNNNP